MTEIIGNLGQDPVARTGNTLFRAMMVQSAAALEIDSDTFRPVGQRPARLVIIQAQAAAEQTYAENIAYTVACAQRTATGVEPMSIDS